MSSGIPSLTILSEEQKFNGENLLQWKTNMTQLLGSKGLLGYIDGNIPKPTTKPVDTEKTDTTTPTTSPVYSTTPTLDEWVFRDQLARGHITLNCTDVASLGVITMGTAKDAWESIQAEWGKSTDMRRSHAQEALNRTIYAEGTDIQEHIKMLRTRKAALDSLSTSPVSDEAWRGIIIRSIPPTPKWLPVIPSLYALTTSADIVSTLFAHGMILGRDTPKVSTNASSSNTVLAAHDRDEGCENPKCKAKNKRSHKTKDCYWEGGGKEGQFPPNFGHRSRANAASSKTNQTESFVLSARVPKTPGYSGILIHDESEILVDQEPKALAAKEFESFGTESTPTFMDSGASDTMFIERTSFSEYKAIEPRMGSSAKASGGKFEIVGEGSVTQRYKVDSKERTVTYTRALHTPSLNANLVSVSALDRVGLTTSFGSGKGITRRKDGTLILAARGESGMYLLGPIKDEPGITMAMSSLSQAVSLEQWRRHLTHCSPLTIQDMANNRLVDGLRISANTLHGKCEDCILGRQTRRPFDGTTEKDLLPLDLVSFDLWGPSRVQSAGGKLYLMIIVDAGTSYKSLAGAYLSDKADVTTLAAFEIFRAQAETITGRKVRRLRTDRAYESAAWQTYCQTHGITHEFTAPYSSAQNGLSERAIRTTMDDVRTLLRDSDLGHSYWAEAAAYSIETRNLIPSRRHPDGIPSQAFTGKRQDISHLRVFGAKCWAKLPTTHGVQVAGGYKLDPRSIECRLLGYATGAGNYKVQDVTSRRVFVSRDVVFEEGHPRRTSASVGEKTSLFNADVSDDVTSLTNAEPTQHLDNKTATDADRAPDLIANQGTPVITEEPRRSICMPQPSKAGLQSTEYHQRESTSKGEGQDWATDNRRPQASLAIDGLELQLDQENATACLAETRASHHIPHSYQHAMATDPERWTIPMKLEMEMLKAKHTWDLVKPPPGANVMGSMWVYDIKWDGDTLSKGRAGSGQGHFCWPLTLARGQADPDPGPSCFPTSIFYCTYYIYTQLVPGPKRRDTLFGPSCLHISPFSCRTSVS
jgi:hypothetical protein